MKRDLHAFRLLSLFGVLVGCNAVDPGEVAWSAAQTIDEEGPSFDPRVALDTNDAALVVWQKFQQPESDGVFSARGSSDGRWSTVWRIDATANTPDDPRVGVDAQGNGVAVWGEGITRERREIWANRFTVDGGWGMAVRLDSENAGDAERPQLAVNPSGHAVAVWHQSDGVRENIWSSWLTSDGEWEDPVLIEHNDAGHAGRPQVAMDPQGNAIAVWYQDDGSHIGIWANRLTLNAGWGNPRRIDGNGAGDTRAPFVAMDPSGNAVAVWRQWNGAQVQIWANRFTPGPAWGSAQRIDAAVGDADSPEVGVDAEGHALAVWTQFDGIRVEPWANLFIPSRGWGMAERIGGTPLGDTFDAHVAVSESGRAVAVWVQEDDYPLNLWSNVYEPGQGWSFGRRVDPSQDGYVRRPHVAISPSGSAVAVWWRAGTAETGPARIWSARLEPR